ncbi:hypothetical protein TSMEX_010431 [Taenia solium]|eukprot:TsM_000352000 transcript=TsM_000352000 gene=TsM_000352000
MAETERSLNPVQSIATEFEVRMAAVFCRLFFHGPEPLGEIGTCEMSESACHSVHVCILQIEKQVFSALASSTSHHVLTSDTDIQIVGRAVGAHSAPSVDSVSLPLTNAEVKRPAYHLRHIQATRAIEHVTIVHDESDHGHGSDDLALCAPNVSRRYERPCPEGPQEHH